jgi:membrane-associated phospholipid phosphatase
MVDIVKRLYAFDTNTNVCPSIHCLGSYATTFAGLHSKKLRGPWWKLSFILTAILISASTVFLKQHSILDVLAAIGVSLVCYAVQYVLFPRYMTARK